MGDGVQERIAKNNLTFREANDKIRAKADEYDAPLERVPFLCECPIPGCLQIVRLTLDEYADVRANPKHFLTAPGHEQAEPSRLDVEAPSGESSVEVADLALDVRLLRQMAAGAAAVGRLRPAAVVLAAREVDVVVTGPAGLT